MIKDALKKCSAEIMQTITNEPNLTDCINTLSGVGFALDVLAECLDDGNGKDSICLSERDSTGIYEDGVSPDDPSDPDDVKEQESRDPRHNRGFWG